MNKDYKHLWQQFQQGNKEALFELYNDMYFHLVRYGLSVYCDNDLVKDCINQLFLKLWDKRSMTKEVDNVKSYLFTTLKRLIIDYLNTENKIHNSLRNLSFDDEPCYEDILIASEKNKEQRAKLKSALTSLSPKQIELIRLKFFENLSYKEIALVSSQSIKTSYNIIYDAIKALRQELQK